MRIKAETQKKSDNGNRVGFEGRKNGNKFGQLKRVHQPFLKV
jgi:hypothetical protein